MVGYEISISCLAEPFEPWVFFLFAFLNRVGAMLFGVLPSTHDDCQNQASFPSPIFTLLMSWKDPCLYHQRVDQARSTLYLYASTKTIAIVGLEPLQIIQGLGSPILLLSWADMLLASWWWNGLHKLYLGFLLSKESSFATGRSSWLAMYVLGRQSYDQSVEMIRLFLPKFPFQLWTGTYLSIPAV